MSKKEHICKDSEHIGKLAAENDFFNWQTLLDANPGLKPPKRANPNVLYKATAGGDKLDIPEKEEKRESCTAGEDPFPTCVFEVPTYGMWLRLRILKEDFTPVKHAPYELQLDDDPNLHLRVETTPKGEVKRFNVDDKELPLKGQTGDNGQIEHQIPIRLETAVLTVRVKAEDTDPPGAKKSKAVRGDVPIRWQLQIGRLNPVKEAAPDMLCLTGVQQRLNNLAINAGKIEEALNSETQAAVTAFQKFYKITDIEGRPETNTQAKLYDVHDGPVPVPVPPP
jgi:hypothetical protein